MLEFLHMLLLAALGGVRLRDAIEAVAYERVKPPGPRHEALSVGAHLISIRADRAVEEGRKVR